jgi:hypothetical protein
MQGIKDRVETMSVVAKRSGGGITVTFKLDK